eukprot:2430731-Pyramimonas_sp.AAC.1
MSQLSANRLVMWMTAEQSSVRFMRLICALVILAVTVAGLFFPLSVSNKILKSKRICAAANMLSAGGELKPTPHRIPNTDPPNVRVRGILGWA